MQSAQVLRPKSALAGLDRWSLFCSTEPACPLCPYTWLRAPLSSHVSPGRAGAGVPSQWKQPWPLPASPSPPSSPLQPLRPAQLAQNHTWWMSGAASESERQLHLMTQEKCPIQTPRARLSPPNTQQSACSEPCCQGTPKKCVPSRYQRPCDSGQG